VSPAEAFVWPAAWPLLLVGPLWWAGAVWAGRRRTARLRALVGPRLPYLAPERSPRRRALRDLLFAAALAALGLALMQPVWGIDARRVEQRGVDILVCLDVSKSMLARDLAPSRLGRAQAELRALAARTRGDRLGLCVFAGEARLFVPLTRDIQSFAELGELADPWSVERPGTDLGAALDAGLAALGGADGQGEVILLISDGEDHDGGGRRAAEAVAARGVVVHAVGFGSARGAKIAVPDADGESFLRDEDGADVVSAMDADGLRAIAAATGGSFVDAGAEPRPLVTIYEREILPRAQKVVGEDAAGGRANRFQLPLGLAVGLLLAWCAIRERKA
jgi:Ca-activated chloride channel family protein